MLHVNKNVKEKYETIDPYIKQTQEDARSWDYRRFDETPEGEIDTQYRDDYHQYDLGKLRDKRQLSPDEGPDEGPKGGSDETPIVYEKFLTPLYVITAFFAAMLIIGPFLVRKGPNRGIAQACVMLSAFCMWIFWFTIYFGQMNPLMGPRLENTTVAWIAYKLGNPFGNTT